MDLSEITNKEEFSSIVINELKTYGVKYQKEKRKKSVQIKSFRNTIFCAHLHVLDLTDVILSSGKVVQIPKFVAEACNRVLEQVETEGIFRKAGSFIRQKEIRINLEAGVCLGKSHHVIDVANVIKYFFRELPESLIPPSIHATLFQSLLSGENSVTAILLTCLLLPPLTLNTLSFFMQFLYTVSLNEKHNKMSIENLAIIFAPGLMPCPNINSHRFKNHVKVVRILIENANTIGTISKSIRSKLQEISKKLPFEADSTDYNMQTTVHSGIEIEQKSESAKRKKKRRSDMFHGLRKMVGTAMGSTEYLDDTFDGKKSNIHLPKLGGDVSKESKTLKIASTAGLKENIKRKLADPVSAFSAKKKETKKSRFSLGGERHFKNNSLDAVVTPMQRRWSNVGSGWSKCKTKDATNKKYHECNNFNADAEIMEDKEDDIGKSNMLTDFQFRTTQFSENACHMGIIVNDSNDNSCCIQVPKDEYEEAKERVVTTEMLISNDIGVVGISELQNLPFSLDISRTKRVQTQYERMVTETKVLSSPVTEHLAQSLSRGLNIRRNIDQRVIRSPSARKIGTIRRRSQDKIRLSRSSSWHIRSSSNAPINQKSIPLLDVRYTQNQLNPKLFYEKNIQTTVPLNSSYSEIKLFLPPRQHNLKGSLDKTLSNEEWMSGEVFFRDTQTIEPVPKVSEDCFHEMHFQHIATPVMGKYTEKSPMLPPKSLPRKMSNVRTPLNNAKKPSTTSKLPYINRIAESTPFIEETSGRASIAQLRAQNAGMVLAKAKLFDGLESNSKARRSINAKINTVTHSKCDSIALEKSACIRKDLSRNQNHIVLNETKAPQSTPKTKRHQKSNSNSPCASKQRHRNNGTKLSRKQLIKSIVSDDKLTKSHNSKELPLNYDNGMNGNVKSDTYKMFNHCRNPKSPRRVKKSVAFISS